METSYRFESDLEHFHYGCKRNETNIQRVALRERIVASGEDKWGLMRTDRTDVRV